MRLGCERQFKLIDGYLNLMVNSESSDGAAKEAEVTIEMPDQGQKSAMNKARENMKAEDDGPTITWEKTVTEDDLGGGRGRRKK